MSKEPDICEDLKTMKMLIQLRHVKDLLLLIDIAETMIEKEGPNLLKRCDH